MSNTLAIAAVTSTIRYLLERSVQAAQPGPVGGAKVVTLRPSDLGNSDLAGPAGLNVYCYLATPNHAWNLNDLPARRSDGTLAARPVAAVDLHYLVTCFGAEESLDPQRLLGRAVIALKTTSVLTRDVVTDALAHYAAQTETAFLSAADLADEVELVKLSPVPLSLEEMSKLWGVLDCPYQLSLTYLATVVLVSASTVPSVALPVQTRSITVGPSRPPQVSAVRTDPDGGQAVTGSVLVVSGSGLLPPPGAGGAGPGVVRVALGPVELVPESGGTSSELRVRVTDAVPAGVHGLTVRHRSAPSGGAPARTVAVSNGVPVVVHPTVAVAAVGDPTVTLTLTPPAQPGQQVSVPLLRLDPDHPDQPAELSLLVASRSAADGPLAAIDLPRRALLPGRWLLRVQVDGVQSVAGTVDGVYRTPELVVP